MLTADVYRVLYSFIKIQIRTNRFFVDFTQFLPLQRTFFCHNRMNTTRRIFTLDFRTKKIRNFSHTKKKTTEIFTQLRCQCIFILQRCLLRCYCPLSYRDSEGEDKDTYVEVREIFFLLMKFSGEKTSFVRGIFCRVFFLQIRGRFYVWQRGAKFRLLNQYLGIATIFNFLPHRYINTILLCTCKIPN